MRNKNVFDENPNLFNQKKFFTIELNQVSHGVDSITLFFLGLVIKISKERPGRNTEYNLELFQTKAYRTFQTRINITTQV